MGASLLNGLHHFLLSGKEIDKPPGILPFLGGWGRGVNIMSVASHCMCWDQHCCLHNTCQDCVVLCDC